MRLLAQQRRNNVKQKMKQESELYTENGYLKRKVVA